MSYFIFDNKRIDYTESGTGTPLLLLHGNTASSKMFLDIASRYEENYNVILMDFLGHGQSDRLEEFPADLWYYEAQQVLAFLEEKHYTNVNLVGSSGGALVAINAALEAPERICKVIADSFEGETPLKAFTETVIEDREHSKQEEGSIQFYSSMHGDDWEQVVDNDTHAISRHAKEIGFFFHKKLETLKPDILMTGSKMDEFITMVAPDYFEDVYGQLCQKIGHGQIYLFEQGGHPAMLSNPEEFYRISQDFFSKS